MIEKSIIKLIIFCVIILIIITIFLTLTCWLKISKTPKFQVQQTIGSRDIKAKSFLNFSEVLRICLISLIFPGAGAGPLVIIIIIIRLFSVKKTRE
jgi:hypothetical protein